MKLSLLILQSSIPYALSVSCHATACGALMCQELIRALIARPQRSGIDLAFLVEALAMSRFSYDTHTSLKNVFAFLLQCSFAKKLFRLLPRRALQWNYVRSFE